MINQAVILAAGESSRFWPLNSTHKSLLKIMGKPLILYTIESLIKAGINDIIIIQCPKKDAEEELKNYKINADIKYIVQPQPNGMGNAIMLAKDLISGHFFVLHAHKVTAGDYLEIMIRKFKESKAGLIFLGIKTDKPWLYGMAKIEKDRVKGLVEKPEKGREPSDIKVIGTYLLPKNFFEYYQKVEEHQYAFEDALDLYAKENEARIVMVSEDPYTFKYPWHLFDATKSLMDQYLKPEIDKSAKIAKNVTIEGKVYIGKRVKIFENAVIKGQCFVGDDVTIGNNALIRDYVDLEKNTVVGAFCEVARSIFQENVHTHSGYFGDSVFDKNSKAGAGTVTANVRIDRGEILSVVKGEKRETGKRSLGCFVGEGTMIGVNSSLMPGLLIGKNSLVGPNSLVSENVADKTLYYTAFEKVVKKRS